MNKKKELFQTWHCSKHGTFYVKGKKDENVPVRCPFDLICGLMPTFEGVMTADNLQAVKP